MADFDFLDECSLGGTLIELRDETDFKFLEHYSISGLEGLRNEIEKRIEAMRNEKIATLRRELLERSRLLNIDPQSLFPDVPAKKNGNGAKPDKEPSLPKYRDPVTGKTWTGRGKRPGWFNPEQSQEFII